jgi:hypothetical protein
MSVIFDNKVFGDNFGSGFLAVTLLAYRTENFDWEDFPKNAGKLAQEEPLTSRSRKRSS